MLLKGGAKVGTIVGITPLGTSGTGSYSWPIASTGTTGSEFQVVVQSISQPTMKGRTVGYFTQLPPELLHLPSRLPLQMVGRPGNEAPIRLSRGVTRAVLGRR